MAYPVIRRSWRHLQAALCCSALATIALAQNGGVLQGGPGHDVLVGTDGWDIIVDPGGPDGDALYDAPGASDGKQDILDSTDGDNSDQMFGGPEDSFHGDPGDVVHIRKPGSKTEFLWHGTIAEYDRIRALMFWLRYEVLDRLLAGGDSSPASQWAAALNGASDALLAATPQSEWIVLGEHFDLDLPPIDHLPLSPYGYLGWFVYPDAIDPVEAAAHLEMTRDQFLVAANACQALLAYVASGLADMPSD